MVKNFLCALGLFILNTLHGSAQDPTAHLSLPYHWTEIFLHERITFRCEIVGAEDKQWKYQLRTPFSGIRETQNEYTINYADESHNGEYSCKGVTEDFSTNWSNTITVTVTPQKPKAQLRADRTFIRAWESSTLTCSVNPPASGWKYVLYNLDKMSERYDAQYDSHRTYGQFRVSEGGMYRCFGERGILVYSTDWSDSVTINRILSNTAVVSREPQWTAIYSGERITLRCDIKDGSYNDWTYEWNTTGCDSISKENQYGDISATFQSDGQCKCRGKHSTQPRSFTEWSSPITLKVSAKKPKAELKADDLDIPVDGHVTLTCYVNSSSSWEYNFWYKTDSSSEQSIIQDARQSTGQMHVSKGGFYSCSGSKGYPHYFSESSDEIGIKKNIANKAVVTLEPNWSKFYSSERIMLRCEIKDGEDIEWEYEWNTTSTKKPPKERNYIMNADAFNSGDYRCKGKKKKEKSSTDWSDPITLTVSSQTQPVLNVTPSWLLPGDTVTLTCGAEHKSEGWRFYWYRAVPKFESSYSYELLPGSSNGTDSSCYMVHAQTLTAGYACRAGRGHPVFYTKHSKPKFVWSGDLHSPASLTVSPNSVQHFTSDHVELNCEGNSTRWRVRRFLKENTPVHWPIWQEMTGSMYTIDKFSENNGIYWCESASGMFSNAVNITKQNDKILLLSPVHPLMEGNSTSLSCKLKRQTSVSEVFFYLNGKLIQNDTRRELNISSVSKSHEGFYKCQSKGMESSQSWMSVRAVARPENSSFPTIAVIASLISGIILVFLLLLLFCYRRSKNPGFIRPVQSECINQGTAGDNVGAQGGPHHAPSQDPTYSSIERKDIGTEVADQGDVTYSLIELKNDGRKGRSHGQNENTIYSDVKMGTADNGLTYAQVSYHTGKEKKKRGKSCPGQTEESFYSEVKPSSAVCDP